MRGEAVPLVNPLQDLQQLIRQYVNHRIRIRGLAHGLSALAIPISESGDAEATALSGLVWALISEYDYGDRSDRSVRDALRLAVPVSFSPSTWGVRTTSIGTHAQFHSRLPYAGGTAAPVIGAFANSPR